MEFEMGDIQAFIDLGLTITEAKIYIALLDLGKSKVSPISEKSKVARPDVYRGLSNLLELGLVEKIIAHPLIFRANPIENGIALLLEQKNNEYAKIEAQSVTLISKLKNKNGHNHFSKSHFVLVPSKKALIKNLCRSIKNAHERIDVFTSSKRLKFACHCLFEELEMAWQKGVKGRAIIEVTSAPVFDFQKTCWRNPHAKVRYIHSFPKTVMAIYDSKEAYIFVENAADLTESSALWTNNLSLVSLAQYGFNSCWKSAEEETTIILKK